MAYLLLTGATGLVGRYLLRNFLQEEVRLAVLVRASKYQTALERIEAVMGRWESLAGRSLPRPIVLEGDLCQENLALDQQQRSWVADHCDTVLHNAASMTFREDKRGEPFRTNVEGMRRVLELCQDAGIRKFHHVSTAYICGLREGRILETEIDLGQQLGNVYERSKLTAEKMVREAHFLQSLTVYRPASVIGDSQNGYTTSYHGFYLPLQLASAIANKIPPEQMDQRFFSLLGLDGGEGKNIVPVDWLAATLVYLVTHPEHHNNTYHLCSPNPVPVRLLQEVIQEAISRYQSNRATSIGPQELAAYEQSFRDHMMIYRSHWRNDPTFDRSNTDRAAGHLPCPEMDRELLLRVARFPVENNFAQQRYEPVNLRFDIHKHLERLVQAGPDPSDSNGSRTSVALQISGVGGGQWRLLVKDGNVVGARLGLGHNNGPGYYLNAETFASLAERRLTVQQSINAGRVIVEGVNGSQPDMADILEQVVLGEKVVSET